MYKLWLTFAQTATILLAIFFVISTLRPELLPWKPHPQLITIKETTPSLEQSRPDSFNEAAKRAMPSVVNIFTRQDVEESQHPLLSDPMFQRFFGQQFESQQPKSNLGSGVIVSSDGYILTNAHLIEAADKIEVALPDGRKIEAEVVGSDADTDLAVLKVDLQNLPIITFGYSEQAQVGDVVLAIGNPFGVGQSVTMGIIGALGRTHVGISTFENFIQTDAAVNPGNSGGALTDTNGNLIGINTAIYSRSGGSLGIGFAIPVHIAKTIMEQIIQSGSVVRGWLGISMQDMTQELANSFNLEDMAGALIASVLKDGPADHAGIKPGDIMIAVEGNPISNASELLNNVAILPPGETIIVTIKRNGEEKNIQIKVGERPKQI